MAWRGRLLRQLFKDGRRGYSAVPEGPYARVHASRTPRPAEFDEELEAQQNSTKDRRLAEDRMAFQQERASLKEEIHRMNLVITDIRAEKDAHSRELIEKSLKFEAELRASESLRNDLILLRSEVQTLTQDLKRAQAEHEQIPFLIFKINSLQLELEGLRVNLAAIEREKKRNSELLERGQFYCERLVSVPGEVEMLRADLANSEARPWVGTYGFAP